MCRRAEGEPFFQWLPEPEAAAPLSSSQATLQAAINKGALALEAVLGRNLFPHRYGSGLPVQVLVLACSCLSTVPDTFMMDPAPGLSSCAGAPAPEHWCAGTAATSQLVSHDSAWIRNKNK